MSTPTLVAPATDAAGSLPYHHAVPGAVIGTWADDTDQALFVAPDKLLSLLRASLAEALREGKAPPYHASNLLSLYINGQRECYIGR